MVRRILTVALRSALGASFIAIGALGAVACGSSPSSGTPSTFHGVNGLDAGTLPSSSVMDASFVPVNPDGSFNPGGNFGISGDGGADGSSALPGLALTIAPLMPVVTVVAGQPLPTEQFTASVGGV